MMNYREIGKTGILTSEIGLGCEYIMHSSGNLIKKVVHTAVDNGINYIDIFAGGEASKRNFGNAIASIRKKVIIAAHIGAGDINGQYKKIEMRKLEKLIYDFLI